MRQRLTPFGLSPLKSDSTRSYILTVQFSLSHACYLVTYPVAGWIGAAAGQPAAAAVLAAVATISTGSTEILALHIPDRLHAGSHESVIGWKAYNPPARRACTTPGLPTPAVSTPPRLRSGCWLRESGRSARPAGVSPRAEFAWVYGKSLVMTKTQSLVVATDGFHSISEAMMSLQRMLDDSLAGTLSLLEEEGSRLWSIESVPTP